MQLALSDVVRRLEKGAVFIELLGVEDSHLNMSEQVQERARRAGMMPIHPARRTVNVEGTKAHSVLGGPGAYAR